MSRLPPPDPTSEMAYLRPLVRRLGADEVHRLVDLIVQEGGELEGTDEPED